MILNGTTLLLEQPELSLHEEVVRQLPAMFARLARGKSRRQAIISTHSYAMLDDGGIQPEEIINVELSVNGTIFCAPSEDALILMENGLSAAEPVLPETRVPRVKQLSFLDL